MLNDYNPSELESKRAKIWEENGYFDATLNPEKKNFSIMIPPPNVTGILHMWHILNNSIQDTLVRRKRMQGYNTLWQPGTDHSGIATQHKVAEKLRSEWKTKEDLGREWFIDEARKRKEKHWWIITSQLRKLWASLDWKKERFTMDDWLSRAVKEIFIKLYNDWLIYHGNYMVNRCPHCLTALADDEVEHIESEGKMRDIKYQIQNSDQFLTVSTTRPETLLGDTWVAVNPKDSRYTQFIWKNVILPLVGRVIPIIADEYVEMEFWTGVVKMTPAHDPNDFEVSKRQNLEVLNIFTPDAKINENGWKYAWLDRFKAREAILKDLKESWLLLNEKTHNHAVGECYRCHTIIEPRISKQRFVKIKPLAQPALEAVKNWKIKIQPKRREKVYYHRLENIKDWCISRQLWRWHRIPAWYWPDEQIFVGRNQQEAQQQAEKHYGHPIELRQDEDVLDTWFSSALRPFSTLWRPDKTPELEYFYPNSMLITAADIIFFRVARMVMFGIYTMWDVPFHDVFLHGIVRDEQGRKMSKSLWNSPDPLDLIAKYWSDAIRWSMIYNISPGQDFIFSEKLIETWWNFANKVWNATKFVLMNTKDFNKNSFDVPPLRGEGVFDQRIYSRLQTTIQTINSYLDKFQLDEATKTAYEFFKWDFCDRYLEIAKVRLYTPETPDQKATAQYIITDILDQSLRLLHPFIPFVTEECRQQLHEGENKTIMLADYPAFDQSLLNPKAEKSIVYLQEVITAIRNIRAEANINPWIEVSALIKTANQEEQQILKKNSAFLSKLAKLSNLQFWKEIKKPDLTWIRVIWNSEIYIPLAGLLDIEAETKKIITEITKIQSWLENTQKKLSDETFLSKAPAEIIQRERKNLIDYQEKLIKLEENLKLLK